MSPCMKPNREREHLERGLNDLTRRRPHRDDADLVQFAARLRTTTTPTLAPEIRDDIWKSVLLSSATATSRRGIAQSSPVPRKRIDPAEKNTWRIPGMSIPRSVPAPAVLMLGVLIALIVALSGFGHDGHDMATPTAYAQQAATAIASPASPQPTSTLTISDLP